MFVAHTIHTTGRKTTVLFTGAILFALLGLFVPQTWAVGPDAKPDGEKLYKEYCAHCHEGQVTRAPPPQNPGEVAGESGVAFTPSRQNAHARLGADARRASRHVRVDYG